MELILLKQLMMKQICVEADNEATADDADKTDVYTCGDDDLRR